MSIHNISFRPGALTAPLAKYCSDHGCTPSEAIRTALAKLLKVTPPAMPRGRPVASGAGQKSGPASA